MGYIQFAWVHCIQRSAISDPAHSNCLHSPYSARFNSIQQKDINCCKHSWQLQDSIYLRSRIRILSLSPSLKSHDGNETSPKHDQMTSIKLVCGTNVVSKSFVYLVDTLKEHFKYFIQRWANSVYRHCRNKSLRFQKY